MGVDYAGNAVIDPTENVKALTEAANLRQDDLRKLNNQRIKSELRSLRSELKTLKRHLREIRGLESDRLDKVRQVDVTAGNTASERSQTAIQTLAVQTASERETLRNLVDARATTVASQTSEQYSGLVTRIAQLEKSSYEGAGKQTIVDPMMAEFVAEIKALRLSSAGRDGHVEAKQESAAISRWAIGIVCTVFGLLLSLLGVLGYAVAK